MSRANLSVKVLDFVKRGGPYQYSVSLPIAELLPSQASAAWTSPRHPLPGCSSNCPVWPTPLWVLSSYSFSGESNRMNEVLIG